MISCGGGGGNFGHSSDFRIIFIISEVLELFWSFMMFRMYFGHFSGFKSILVILEVSRY